MEDKIYKKMCPKCEVIVEPKSNWYGGQKCPNCRISLTELPWLPSELFQTGNDCTDRNDIKHPFSGFLGHVPRYYILNGEEGIAISNDNKKIVLMRGSLIKMYDIDQIRRHEIREYEYYRVVPGRTLGSAIGATYANAKLKNKALQETGLFINIKDVDNPEWHIYMDSDEQKRWNEILNQLYENSLS